MAKMYELKRDAESEKDFEKPRRIWPTRKAVVRVLDAQGGPFEMWLWRHSHDGSNPPETRKRFNVEAAAKVITRFLKDTKPGDHVFIQTAKGQVLIRTVMKRIVPVLPPNAKSEGWTQQDKWLWRMVMILPGVIYQGSYVCRNMRGSDDPSQHAFCCPPQAHDFRFRSKRQGDRRVAKIRAKKGHIWFVCWENCTNHRSWEHAHFEKKPKKTGMPPCMQ